MKYHDESINVSIVSVSRLAGLPQLGHWQDKKASCLTSGLPLPSGIKSSGNITGKSFSGTGTAPQASQ